jgi:hypothetical protein
MLEKLIAPVAGLLDKFIEDKDQKNALAHEIATMAERHAQELAKAQIEVNKAEASNPSLFVSGWRPFVGWACGLALFWHFIGLPIALFLLTLFRVDIPDLPMFDMETLLTVLMGMLGLGGMRTWEKTKNVHRK